MENREYKKVLNKLVKGLGDIQCIAEFGSRGVHDNDIPKENYDSLFDAIRTKALQLEKDVDKQNV